MTENHTTRSEVLAPIALPSSQGRSIERSTMDLRFLARARTCSTPCGFRRSRSTSPSKKQTCFDPSSLVLPATPTSGLRKLRSGFTLIEIMVVIALIGVLTAMILPEMKGTYDDVLLRSVSREIINTVNITSSHAVSHNQPHRLKIDTKSGRYCTEKRVFDGGFSDRYAPVKDLPGSMGTFDTRVSLIIRNSEQDADSSNASMNASAQDEKSMSATESCVSFYPDGTADAVEILLKSPAGYRLALKINPISSRIEILDLEKTHQ